MDRVEERCTREKETETALTEEQLDAAICRGLRSVMGKAEPSPASWRRIQQRVERSQRRGRRRGTPGPEDS